MRSAPCRAPRAYSFREMRGHVQSADRRWCRDAGRHDGVAGCGGCRSGRAVRRGLRRRPARDARPCHRLQAAHRGGARAILWRRSRSLFRQGQLSETDRTARAASRRARRLRARAGARPLCGFGAARYRWQRPYRPFRRRRHVRQSARLAVRSDVPAQARARAGRGRGRAHGVRVVPITLNYLSGGSFAPVAAAG